MPHISLSGVWIPKKDQMAIIRSNRLESNNEGAFHYPTFKAEENKMSLFLLFEPFLSSNGLLWPLLSNPEIQKKINVDLSKLDNIHKRVWTSNTSLLSVRYLGTLLCTGGLTHDQVKNCWCPTHFGIWFMATRKVKNKLSVQVANKIFDNNKKH